MLEKEVKTVIALKSKYERRVSVIRIGNFPAVDADIFNFFSETKNEKIIAPLIAEFDASETFKEAARSMHRGGCMSPTTPYHKAMYGYHCLNYYETYHLHSYQQFFYIHSELSNENDKYKKIMSRYCFLNYFEYLLDYLDDIISDGKNTDLSLRLTNEQQKTFVDLKVIEQLKEIKDSSFDLNGLVLMCEEINRDFSQGNYLSVMALMRTIMNHVPPIFKCENFDAIVNNYGSPKENVSFKKQMELLKGGAKNLADEYLHKRISSSVKVPSASTVNYAPVFNNLLEEIVRLLKNG